MFCEIVIPTKQAGEKDKVSIKKKLWRGVVKKKEKFRFTIKKTLAERG